MSTDLAPLNLVAIPGPTDIRSEGRTYLLTLLYWNVVCGVPVDADAWRDAYGQAADYQTVVDARRELAQSEAVAS